MPDLRIAVLGASFAGCLSAAALAAPGREIVLLERDTLPDVPAARPGVPQGAQPHVFLQRGLRETETLLPGLADRLRSGGAVPVDTGRLPWLTEWGWLPRGRRIEILSMTRPLLEHEVRRSAAALPGVQVHDGVEVRGLSRRGGTWTVRTAAAGELVADVVIDASGRSSRLPVWLRDGRFPQPGVEDIDARVGYATRVYAGARGDLEGIAIPLNAKAGTGGLALPAEGDRWLITLIGCGEQRPSRDVAQFDEALGRLSHPAIAELAGRLEPLGDVAIHRQTANRRIRYERVRELPPGLLVVGDALCCFNPVYGQGITVAALQAAVLRRHSADIAGGASLRRLQRRIASCTAVPWTIVTGADARYPSCEDDASLGQRLGDAWARRLTQAAVAGDRAAGDALSTAYHLIAPPTSLVRPRVVLAGILRRPLYGEPAPPNLPAPRSA